MVLASGSLKRLAEEYEVSYPTIRQRLDRIIERVRTFDAHPEDDPFEARMRMLVSERVIGVDTARQLLALLSLLQPYAASGRYRQLVLACYLGATLLGMLLLAAGWVGWLAGQPAHVTQTLMFAGAVTAALMVYNDWRILRPYRRAELHKSVASDL